MGKRSKNPMIWVRFSLIFPLILGKIFFDIPINTNQIGNTRV